MTLTPELEAHILRYHHVEKWRIGTIARQLHVHHGSVERVLRQAGLPRLGKGRPSAIDLYLPFIRQTLEKFPTLTASRLYVMAKERGYCGGPDHFRHLISHHRPRPAAEAYLRLVTLPGAQGQVDWAHFDHVQIGRARRPLMGFVMVLSWCRRIFLRFFLDARMENFLRGHVGAFEAWDELPRVLLYDNLKSAVLERQGDAIRFHPALLEFAGHYRFEPRPVAVYPALAGATSPGGAHRSFQAAGEFRLGLADALRSGIGRGPDGSQLPRRGRQCGAGRHQRGGEIDAGAQCRPSGADSWAYGALHHRR